MHLKGTKNNWINENQITECRYFIKEENSQILEFQFQIRSKTIVYHLFNNGTQNIFY